VDVIWKLLTAKIPHYQGWGLLAQVAVILPYSVAAQLHPALPGLAIGFLGLGGVLMAFRTEEFKYSRYEKIMWVFISAALLTMEIRVLVQDQNDRNRSQAQLLRQELNTFSVELRTQRAVAQNTLAINVVSAKLDNEVRLEQALRKDRPGDISKEQLDDVISQSRRLLFADVSDKALQAVSSDIEDRMFRQIRKYDRDMANLDTRHAMGKVPNLHVAQAELEKKFAVDTKELLSTAELVKAEEISRSGPSIDIQRLDEFIDEIKKRL